jgi:hypothetical protein
MVRWRTLLAGKGVDQAVANKNATADFLTFNPVTESGNELLQTIGAPLVELERMADDFSFWAGMGNPYAATAIKTTLLGGLELAIPAKGVKSTGIKSKLLSERDIAKRRKEIKRVAEEMDIDLKPREIEASLIQAAKRMSSDERAASAPALQNALIKADKAAKRKRNNLYNKAKRKKAYVAVSPIKTMAKDLRQRLDDRGFDLDPGVENMTTVRKSLDELDKFGDKFANKNIAMSHININELERIRRRVVTRAQTAFKAKNESAGASLSSIRKNIDDFLQDQLNEALIKNGKSAIKGDVSAIKAWSKARSFNTRWRKTFRDDKVISQLINLEATPEQISAWLMGTSAIQLKRQAALTIKRIKKVLGDNHPAVEGIRQDFLFEVASPLMLDQPNFRRFLTNYENMIKKNPSLVKELGLRSSDMHQLYRFVNGIKKLPPKVAASLDFSRALAVFFVGHSISRASLRVRLAEYLAKVAFGVDRVSKRKMIKNLAGAMDGTPAIPKGGPLAAEFIAAAAITGEDSINYAPEEEQE